MKIVIRFIGGSKDGETVRSDDTGPADANWAKIYFLGSRNGAVGASFDVMTDYSRELIGKKGVDVVKSTKGALRYETYEVSSREEKPDEVTLHASYVKSHDGDRRR